MSDEEFKSWWTIIQGIMATTMIIPDEEFNALRDTVQRAHSIGPIIDPTAYRDGMDNLEDQSTILNGLAAFRQAIKKVKEDQDERAERRAGVSKELRASLRKLIG